MGPAQYRAVCLSRCCFPDLDDHVDHFSKPADHADDDDHDDDDDDHDDDDDDDDDECPLPNPCQSWC